MTSRPEPLEHRIRSLWPEASTSVCLVDAGPGASRSRVRPTAPRRRWSARSARERRAHGIFLGRSQATKDAESLAGVGLVELLVGGHGDRAAAVESGEFGPPRATLYMPPCLGGTLASACAHRPASVLYRRPGRSSPEFRSCETLPTRARRPRTVRDVR